MDIKGTSPSCATCVQAEGRSTSSLLRPPVLRQGISTWETCRLICIQFIEWSEIPGSGCFHPGLPFAWPSSRRARLALQSTVPPWLHARSFSAVPRSIPSTHSPSSSQQSAPLVAPNPSNSNRPRLLLKPNHRVDAHMDTSTRVLDPSRISKYKGQLQADKRQNISTLTSQAVLSPP